MSILLGTGTGIFGETANFAVGSYPRSVVVGDFNSDGHSDLALVSNVNTASILLGTGSFGAATDFPVGWEPHSVAVADFDGDGDPDLAVANFSDRLPHDSRRHCNSYRDENGDGNAAPNADGDAHPLSVPRRLQP